MRGIDTKRLSAARVLVTGGAGFIGSHLVDALLNLGAKVRVLDNLATGKLENLAHVKDRVEFIQDDIRDLEACQRVAKDIDFVLHEAALGSVPRSLESPGDSIAVNVSGTCNVFTAARDQKVKRVVYASSSSVYGSSEKLPKREGEEGLPLSPYALSKKMDEQLAELFTRCFRLEIVGLRYFNVYGPRQDPRGAYAAVIPRFFAACRAGERPIIYGDGEQSRDFTYVGDVVAANIAALLSKRGAGQAFNVGAGTRTTVNDLAREIARATDFPGTAEHRDPRPGDVLHSIADTSRIFDAFGWRATVTLDAGIKLCAAHYR